MPRSRMVIVLVTGGVLACAADPNQQLIQAAGAGDGQAVQEALSRGASVETSTADGDTPLIIAARKGHEAVVKALIEKGAHPTTANRAGAQAALFAAQGAYTEAVSELATSGGGQRVSSTGRAAVYTRILHLLTPIVAGGRQVTPQPGGVRSTGRARFTTKDGRLRANISTRRQYDRSGGEVFDGVRGLYFPGLQHEFVGRTVVPASPDDILRTEPGLALSFAAAAGNEPLVRERTANGWVFSGGEALQADEWIVVLKPGARTLEVEAAAANPLVFRVGKEGYEYVSGLGTVKTSTGSEYAFPAAGFADWVARQPKPAVR